MTIRVFKYRLEICDEQQLHIHTINRPLYVGIDPSRELCLWAEVDDASPKHLVPIRIHGTGHEVRGGEYLGSAVMGPTAWHVYWGKLDDTNKPTNPSESGRGEG